MPEQKKGGFEEVQTVATIDRGPKMKLKLAIVKTEFKGEWSMSACVMKQKPDDSGNWRNVGGGFIILPHEIGELQSALSKAKDLLNGTDAVAQEYEDF